MKIFYKSILILIVLGVISIFIKGYLYKQEIKNNNVQTVCKFVLCKTFPKTTKSIFTYNINNKWYTNSYGKCPDNYDKKINKFFRIYYSSKDFNKIIVDFSKEIKDTTEILKAGFSKEELE